MRLLGCVVEGQQSSQQAREFKGMRSRTVWHAQRGCLSIVRHSCLQRAEKHWAPRTESGRHRLRDRQRQKKGSGCLRKSLSSTKELIACTSGGSKRSDSRVKGVCAHGILSQGHSGATWRLLSLLCRWDTVIESPGTSVDHMRLITPGRNPRSCQQAAGYGMRAAAASSGQLPVLPAQSWASFSVSGPSCL